MAILFSKVNKAAAANVELLLQQAERHSQSDTEILKKGQLLVQQIPDCLLAPDTEASIECARRVSEAIVMLDSAMHPFKPK